MHSASHYDVAEQQRNHAVHRNDLGPDPTGQAHGMMALQRAAGNSAVADFLKPDTTVQRCGGGCSGCGGASASESMEDAAPVQRMAAGSACPVRGALGQGRG